MEKEYIELFELVKSKKGSDKYNLGIQRLNKLFFYCISTNLMEYLVSASNENILINFFSPPKLSLLDFYNSKEIYEKEIQDNFNPTFNSIRLLDKVKIFYSKIKLKGIDPFTNFRIFYQLLQPISLEFLDHLFMIIRLNPYLGAKRELIHMNNMDFVYLCDDVEETLSLVLVFVSIANENFKQVAKENAAFKNWGKNRGDNISKGWRFKKNRYKDELLFLQMIDIMEKDGMTTHGAAKIVDKDRADYIRREIMKWANWQIDNNLQHSEKAKLFLHLHKKNKKKTGHGI